MQINMYIESTWSTESLPPSGVSVWSDELGCLISQHKSSPNGH